MRILSVAARMPSKRVTNDDILEAIGDHSRDEPKLQVHTYLRLVRGLFGKTGANTRFVLDKTKGETAFGFIKQAMEGALADADLRQKDIDLLIYCGVGKGFKEPANAYFYAKALGMTCSCFDVADACMSWVRSLEIAYNMLQGGCYRRVMIVNGEFNAYDHGFPELFRARDLAQLEYTFPAYTIGEAATATIVGVSDDEWTFDYRSVPELCDLCTIAFEGYAGYVGESPRHNKNGTNRFVSYGKDLFDHAGIHLAALVKESIKDLAEPVLAFPHAASSVAYLEGCKPMGVPAERIFAKVFPAYGNLVSASIPAGIVMAREEGRLKRGDRVVLVPASAGMSFAVVQFKY